jgi:hypothetical protein
MNRFKKILATSIFSLSLSACGGGGGGGSAVNVISNFIEQDLTNLNGSELIISDYTNLISNFQNIISNGEYSSLSAVITGPNSEDIKKANDLLSILNQTEQLWLQTEDLINKQSDNEKYNIYNSKSYKEAYAAYLYLINDVEPIIEKVSKGRSVTLADYNKVAQKEKADEIIKTEKLLNAEQVVSNKVIKETLIIEENRQETREYSSDPEISYTSWSPIYKGGGLENRTKSTKIKNFKETTNFKCSFKRINYLNGNTVDEEPVCKKINTDISELKPIITEEIEKKEGDNPIVKTVSLEPLINKTIEESETYTETTFKDSLELIEEITEGSGITKTISRDTTSRKNLENNKAIVTIKRFVDTITTIPVTKKIFKTRHYTDLIKKERDKY